MRRALPYILFGLVTLLVFQGFLRSGQSLLNVPHLETVEGTRETHTQPRFPRHSRIIDNVVLLPPLFRIYNEGLKAGELRLWNPYLFCGYPAYADPMLHPFYPPQLFCHGLLPPLAAYEVCLMLHLFFSGVAMLWLARTLRWSAAAGTTAGLAWMLFGYNAMWFSTGVLLGVSVFMPLALRAVIEGLEKKSLSKAPLAALWMAMVILGSHPQHALHFFIFLMIWIMAMGIHSREDWRFAVSFATTVAALSVAVGMVEVATRLDSIVHGYRKAGPDMEVLYGNPWALVGQAAGLVIGLVQFHNLGAIDLDFNVYAGVTLFTLALMGAVRGYREKEIRFLVFVAAGTFLVAFLRPLASIFQFIPLLRLSPPSRWLSVFGFCFVLLSARGVDALSKGIDRVPGMVGAGTLIYIAACLAKLGPLTFENRPALMTAFALGLASISAWLARRRLAWGMGVGLGTLLFELVPNALVFNGHFDPAPLTKIPEVLQLARSRVNEPWRAIAVVSAPFLRGSRLGAEEQSLVMTNNALAVRGTEALGGFEAIIPDHYVRFSREAGARVADTGRFIAFANPQSPLLDLAGLKYLIARDDPPGGRFVFVGAAGASKLYENSAVVPRACLVSGAKCVSSEDEAAELLRSKSFNPREAVVLQTSHAVAVEPMGTPGGTVSWRGRSSDQLKLEVESIRPAFLVVSDTDYPGWQAWVDGRQTPLYRANLAFRAVQVPAGRHSVEFRFSPGIVRWGGVGSIASLLITIGWIVISRRNRSVTDSRPARLEATPP